MSHKVNKDTRWLWSESAWDFWYKYTRGEKTYSISDYEETHRYMIPFHLIRSRLNIIEGNN